MNRDGSIVVIHPLFQVGEGGSTPTPSLRDLHFQTITQREAKHGVLVWHSRTPETGGGGCRVCYGAEFAGQLFAAAIWTNPTSPKLPQREWIQLFRYAISDNAPQHTASRMMGWMIRDLRVRYPDVTTLVSYSDPDTHDGTIYRATGWVEGPTTRRTGKGWGSRDRKHTANATFNRVTRWTRKL